MVSGHAGWDDFSCGQQCIVVFAHPDLVSAVSDADGEAVCRSFQKKCVKGRGDVGNIFFAHGIVSAVGCTSATLYGDAGDGPEFFRQRMKIRSKTAADTFVVRMVKIGAAVVVCHNDWAESEHLQCQCQKMASDGAVGLSGSETAETCHN